MFGNLVAFMFSGINVTANLTARLDPQFHYSKWAGNYQDVLPYIQEAFTRVLEQLEAAIDPAVRDEILPVVRQLCEPDPARRGHPRGVGGHTQYSLERYVTILDRLSRTVELHQRIESKV
jgi:hypothetical protein